MYKVASVPHLNPTMKVRATLCFLLVCGILGLLVEGVRDEDRYRREFAALAEGRNFFYGDNRSMKMTASGRRAHITFTLYTKRNQTNGQELRVNDSKKLRGSDFDGGKPTRFVTHGFLNDGNNPSCTLIRDAYLSRSRCNVIIVDWSIYSYRLYPVAVLKIRRIGHEVARMINFLYEQGKLRTKRTTLVGYSLGAHIMGIAGYNTKYQVNYVVGLDPALPGFITAGPDRSISMASGKHVEIIHTNGGVLGYLNAAGHSDFFPNGGKQQTGCSKVVATCSHERAYKLFAESIMLTINATRCESYEAYQAGDCGSNAHVAPMGGLDPKRVRPGKYYLQTGSTPPYSVL